MRGLFPAIEPYEQGMLAVSDGNLVYWETCGNPLGKPALVVHGGLRAALPDSTADPDVVEGYHRLWHDPDPGVRQRAAVEWCRVGVRDAGLAADHRAVAEIQGPQVRDGVRPPRHALRSAQRVAGRWMSVARG